MALFRRGRVPRRIIGRYKREAPAEPVSIDHLIEESRLVAHSATRMAVKNRLIMDAAGRRLDIDIPGLRAAASETLEQLAQQQRAAADYERERGGDPRRGPVLIGLAEALEKDARDREVLDQIVEGARDSAWAEVRSSLERWVSDRSDRSRWYTDPEYLQSREDRMELIKGLDLRDLRRAADEQAAKSDGPAPVG